MPADGSVGERAYRLARLLPGPHVINTAHGIACVQHTLRVALVFEFTSCDSSVTCCQYVVAHSLGVRRGLSLMIGGSARSSLLLPWQKPVRSAPPVCTLEQSQGVGVVARCIWYLRAFLGSLSLGVPVFRPTCS